MTTTAQPWTTEGDLMVWSSIEKAITGFCLEECLDNNLKMSDSSTITDDSEESGSQSQLALLYLFEQRCQTLETELRIRQKSTDEMTKQLKTLRSSKRDKEDDVWQLHERLNETSQRLTLEQENNKELRERMRWNESQLQLMREQQRGMMKSRTRTISYKKKEKVVVFP